MLKKVITYNDYFGEERTEDFFFNLTKSELMEMQLSAEGGLKQRLEKIMQTKDTVRIAEVFKTILRASYGERSEDGKRFIKYITTESGARKYLFDDFEQSPAYDVLYMELLSDEKAMSDFINAILPQVDQPAE